MSSRSGEASRELLYSVYLYFTLLLLDTVAVLGTTHLAQEALAGLASTEDFSTVTLRKTADASSARSALNEHLPYTDVMLLHVKGTIRRHRRTINCNVQRSSARRMCERPITPHRVHSTDAELRTRLVPKVAHASAVVGRDSVVKQLVPFNYVIDWQAMPRRIHEPNATERHVRRQLSYSSPQSVGFLISI